MPYTVLDFINQPTKIPPHKEYSSGDLQMIKYNKQ